MLWIKYSEFGVVMIATCLDDCLVIRNEKGIDSMTDCLKNHEFGLEIENNLRDYLSCKSQVDKEKKTTYVCGTTSLD
jgi:hypothetical protein